MFKLRELEREDVIEINKWRNDDELIANLGAPFRYINIDVDKNWYENYLKNRQNAVRCAIISKENEKEILGLISLLNINYVNQTAELHIMIGNSKNRGMGMGSFAIQEMIFHAFHNLNLRRIELGVLENNEIARKVYEKQGFTVEGIKREAIYKNGKFVNLVLMSLLKKEWEKSYK